MVDFSQLGSVVGDAHNRLIEIYYILLPTFFMVSVASIWFASPAGSPEFIDKLKRAIVATLLLVGFPEITEAILSITNWVAYEISNLDGLDTTIKMVKQRLEMYPENEKSALFGFGDFLLSGITYLSYLILYLARYIMIALYHFSWLFLCCIAPLILSLHVFSTKMTMGLFRSLAEIASWKIVWAVLSLMLKALPFGQMWIEGGWITQVFMCLTISLCMLATPLVVKSLVGSGLTSFASGLSPAVAALSISAPSKFMQFTKFGKNTIREAGSMAEWT